jgi:hypothetical protein
MVYLVVFPNLPEELVEELEVVRQLEELEGVVQTASSTIAHQLD